MFDQYYNSLLGMQGIYNVGIQQQAAMATHGSYLHNSFIEQHLRQKIAELESQHIANGFTSDGQVPALDHTNKPSKPNHKSKLNHLLLLEDCPI